MKALFSSLLVVALLVPASTLRASGPVGLFGIIEKAVFEPSEVSPERLQLWGVFAYADLFSGRVVTVAPGQTVTVGDPRHSEGSVSAPRRGYLYFRVPVDAAQAEVVRREWADLKSVAGTREAVGFGSWFYMGSFAALDPGARSSGTVGTFSPSLMWQGADLRVRLASEPPSVPAIYNTNTGVVKLSEQGSRAAVVRQLREMLATN